MPAELDDLEQVATRSRDPILLTGETGTGKSELCRRIYELKRARHQLEGELVAVNCATVRGDTAMSALFGHARGAFTGADRDHDGLVGQAQRGTLFLDEIGELPMEAQARLLRFIQEGEIRRIGSVHSRKVNVRLICATHRDLHVMIADGRFREDLWYRGE